MKNSDDMDEEDFWKRQYDCQKKISDELKEVIKEYKCMLNISNGKIKELQERLSENVVSQIDNLKDKYVIEK